MRIAFAALLLSLLFIEPLQAQKGFLEAQNRLLSKDDDDENWTDVLPIKGPARTVRVDEATVESRFGKSVEAYRRPLVAAVFDGTGKIKIIEATIYYGAGHPSYSKLFYTYDGKGNKIKKVEAIPPTDVIFYLGSRKVSRMMRPGSRNSTTYSYDAKGNLIAKTIYEGSRLTSKHIYEYRYDAKGELVQTEASDYAADGSLSGKTVYSYDAKDRLIQLSEYARDGTLSDKETYAYDLSGNLIEMTTYGAHGSVFEKKTYTYDLKGRLTGFATYRRGVLSYKQTNSYDNDGNLIERAVQSASENTNPPIDFSTVPFKFFRYEYKFDRDGNWIKRFEGHQVTKFGKTYFEPETVTLRTITYDRSQGPKESGEY